MIALSRLTIIGNLELNTPRVVLKEIMLIHQLSDIKNLLHSQVDIVDTTKPLEAYLDVVAKFINPYENWDEHNLIKAWQFIQGFMSTRISLKWKLDHLGLQTNKYPYSLSSCMLYRICREWNLPVDRHTSVKQMSSIIKIAMLAPKYIRQTICSRVKSNYEDLGDNFNQRLLMIKAKVAKVTNFQPRTYAEAISCFFLYYAKDLSYSSNPLVDYYYYQKFSSYYDEKLNIIQLQNANLLNVNESFNPIFPLEYYSRECLKGLARKAGHNENTSDIDIYNNLQLSYITQNFVEGWQVKLLRTTTVVEWHEITGREDLICFGDYINGFLPYTADELCQLYSVAKSFIHPDNLEEELEENVVNSLSFIAEKRFPTLALVIHRIKASRLLVEKDLLKLRNWYLALQDDEQHYIVNLLTKLLGLGMYMRGWSGNGPWPLKRQKEESKESVKERDAKITLAFWTVYEEKFNPLGLKILKAHLYRYNRGSWNKSQDNRDGKNILARLEKVRSNSDVYACIKMSSNWFVASAYKYMLLFDLPPPFDIRELDYIS